MEFKIHFVALYIRFDDDNFFVRFHSHLIAYDSEKKNTHVKIFRSNDTFTHIRNLLLVSIASDF